MYGIDLFSLHVLNPHFRPREGTQGNYLFHKSFDARATTCICMQLCEDKDITWSELKIRTSLKATYKLKRSIKQQINVVQGQHCPILIIHLECSKYDLHNTTSKIYTLVLWNN